MEEDFKEMHFNIAGSSVMLISMVMVLSIIVVIVLVAIIMLVMVCANGHSDDVVIVITVSGVQC